VISFAIFDLPPPVATWMMPRPCFSTARSDLELEIVARIVVTELVDDRVRRAERRGQGLAHHLHRVTELNQPALHQVKEAGRERAVLHREKTRSPVPVMRFDGSHVFGAVDHIAK
jgi:hypothetical protein